MICIPDPSRAPGQVEKLIQSNGCAICAHDDPRNHHLLAFIELAHLRDELSGHQHGADGIA
jgi:hypothetical protein